MRRILDPKVCFSDTERAASLTQSSCSTLVTHSFAIVSDEADSMSSEGAMGYVPVAAEVYSELVQEMLTSLPGLSGGVYGPHGSEAVQVSVSTAASERNRRHGPFVLPLPSPEGRNAADSGVESSAGDVQGALGSEENATASSAAAASAAPSWAASMNEDTSDAAAAGSAVCASPVEGESEHAGGRASYLQRAAALTAAACSRAESLVRAAGGSLSSAVSRAFTTAGTVGCICPGSCQLLCL